jgi:hypothetical protein
MTRSAVLLLVAVSISVLYGCGPKEMVPPRIDLGIYEAVGLISFTSNAEGNLAEYTTQKFLQIVSESQSGARFIELGDEKDVLESVSMSKIDRASAQAIGETHKVSGIIVGNLDVSDVRPKLRLGPWFAPMGVEAEVEASLMGKMLDTKDGATVWTASGRETRTVAEVSVFPGGAVIFDAENPDQAYGDLVESLVREVSTDLRVTYR